jgi:hypothetical protein
MNSKVLSIMLVICLFAGPVSFADRTWGQPASAINHDWQEPDAGKMWAIGTAWSFDGVSILYREYHYAEDPAHDLPTRVLYRKPDGELIAEKSIDYSASVISPAISQKDYRNNSVVTTEHPLERGARLIRVGYQAHDSERLRSRDVTSRDSLIVDAGFDPYVRQNWEALTGGQSVTTSFLVPARLDSVRISISPTEPEDCRAAAAPVHCFIIRPAGLLRMVSWFVDPIHIAYHPESRRLKSFAGLSNLRDDAGEPLNVLIRFEYL